MGHHKCTVNDTVTQTVKHPIGLFLALGALSAALACADESDGPGSTAPDLGPENVADTTDLACDGQNASAEDTEAERRVLDLVNQERARGARCGSDAMPATGPLTFHTSLVCAARSHSADMARRDYFDHESPEGQSPFERMNEAGYQFSAAGENIALGGPEPESVMQQWMNSDGHCRNILGGDFEDFGVGLASAGGRTYWTQTFGRSAR
jgi:uncharacterized protein YkwD